MQQSHAQLYPPCHILGLPGELRNQIFSYVFDGVDDYPNTRLNIPLVCRTFNSDTRHLTWEHGTHKISAPYYILQPILDALPEKRRSTITALAHPSLTQWADLFPYIHAAGIMPISETIILDRVPNWEKATLPCEDTRTIEEMLMAPEFPHIPLPWEPQPLPDPRALLNKALAIAVWFNPKLERIQLVSSIFSANELERQASLLIHNMDEHLNRLADDEHDKRGAPWGWGRPSMTMCWRAEADIHSYINPRFDDEGRDMGRYDEILVWREGSCVRVKQSW